MSEAQRDILTPVEHYRVADGYLQLAARTSIRENPAMRASFVAEAAVHAELAKCSFTARELRPWLYEESAQPKE